MSLKPQPPRKVIKALSKLGFKIVRKHGSHVVLKHPNGRLTVVPVHLGETFFELIISNLLVGFVSA